MQLRRWPTSLFVALVVIAAVMFTLSSSVPKARAVEASTITAIDESTRSLAGAFSMLAGDMRMLRNESGAREHREAERITADVISRQQLTEAINRLNERIMLLEAKR